MNDRLLNIQKIIENGPFNSTWSSLCSAQIPIWFNKAKFGIFTHWGLFSVPQYDSEWYPRNMYIEGSKVFNYHRNTYGPQDQFGYKDFIPMFTARRFDPDEWLDLIQQAGAQYYMPVAEHHDGFQLYGSQLSHFNSVEMGPHRDIIAELRKATINHHLHFALSNHRAEHWWFMGNGRNFNSDIVGNLQRGDFYWPAAPDPGDHFDSHSQPFPNQEFLDDWLERNCELVDRFHPEMMYFDWWIQHVAFKKVLRQFLAYYYNVSKKYGFDATVNYKYDAMVWNSGINDVERGSFGLPQPFPWQTDTAIGRDSWSYTLTNRYKSPLEIIQTLIDVVSKNGNLLLNFGPKADGSIAQQDRKVLLTIGNWLKINGDGIFNTKPWKIFGEGPTNVQKGAFSDNHALKYTSGDFRFTSKGDSLYVFQLAPENSDALISTLSAHKPHASNGFNGIITVVKQLGVGSVPFKQEKTNLLIHGVLGENRLPRCFKVTLK